MFNKNIIFYLLIFIISNQNNTVNNNGGSNDFCQRRINNCLLCRNDKCKICDHFLGFNSNENETACIRCPLIQNCIFYSNCQCRICNDNYTLCSGTCRRNILNCIQGDTCSNTCNRCKNNYYFSQGECLPVSNIISNCEIYKNNFECQLCQTGYEIQNINNLNTCNSISNNNSNNSTSNNINNNINNSNVNNTNNNVTAIDNCLLYAGDQYTCNKCINNNNFIFYQIEILNPFQMIENRLWVNTEKQNQLLFSGFSSFDSFSNLVNQNNNICKSRTIENCLQIRGNGSFDCILCNSSSYLQLGRCVRFKQNTIPNCEQYGYFSNNLKDRFGYNALKCNKCIQNYFLSNNNCINYTPITGCTTYNSNYNSCLACNNVEGYKLSNGTCVSIINFKKVTFCTTYFSSGNNEGSCSHCNNQTSSVANNEYFLFNNHCNFIQNCSRVNIDSNQNLLCNGCKDNFYWSNNNRECLAIDPSLNCLQIANNNPSQCSACSNSFFPVNNVCSNQLNNSVLNTNCSRGTANYNCNTCKEDFSIQIRGLYFCMNFIQNCLYYDNANQNFCLLCDNGKQPLNGLCIGDVPTSSLRDFCTIYNSNICRSCSVNKYLMGGNCIDTDINNSLDLCKHNPAVITNNYRINDNPFFIRSNNVFTLVNNCSKCVLDDLVIDTVTTTQCIPRLDPNSTNPYQDGTCTSDQIRVNFNFNSNAAMRSNVLTCRLLNPIVGNLYKQDSNCYIYKSSLNSFTFFRNNNITFCAICDSGYSIQNNRCTTIPNCNANSNMFGGCTNCNSGYQLDILGENCFTQINNCLEIIGNNSCLRCNDGYYGVLESAISYGTDNGIPILLGLFGDNITINRRDSNNIKIPQYKWFFFNRTTSSFKFSQCSNSSLFEGNQTLTSSGTNSLTNDEQNRVLAIVNGDNYASFCKINNYMRYNNNSWKCTTLIVSGIVTPTITNILNNNFLNQTTSATCSSSNPLVFSKGRIGGPFCITNAAFSLGDPVSLTFTAKGNCNLHLIDWTNYAADSTDANTSCLFCGGNRLTNPDGNTCDNLNTAAGNDLVTYCTDHFNGVCNSCPTGMSIVNNSCLISTQVLWTGGNTTAQFLTNNNCSKISWRATNISGYRVNFVLEANNNNNVATCLECNTNYVMNYENFSCVRQNKFNFSNCVSTQNLIGCVSCKKGYFSFSSNSPHQFCINIPPVTDFTNNFYDPNCSLYNYDNFIYTCNSCKTGYVFINSICIKNNIPNCSRLISSNYCASCTNGYFPLGGKCIKGNLENCIGYSDRNRCTSCSTGFIRWSLRNSTGCLNITYLTSSFPNCSRFGFSSNSRSGSNEFYCLCNNGQIPLNTTVRLENTFCLPYPISNCRTYQYYTRNYTGTVNCTSCKSTRLSDGTYTNDQYILNNLSCAPRLNNQLIEFCLVYVYNEAACSRCIDGFFVYNKKCMKNLTKPNNIDYCNYSISNGVCLLCIENYYFNSENKCVPLDTNKLIENCYKYNSNQICSLCKRGYLLNRNNVCTLLSSNTFLDINNTCQFDLIDGYKNTCNCIEKYYFDNTDKRCKTVDNCKEINFNGSCKVCNENRYYNINSKTCELSNPLINNCLYYSKNNECNQCRTNYGLNNNQCVLVSNLNPSCDDYILGKRCILCRPGIFNSNGICNLSLPDSMYYSSSTNINEALICKSGYEMEINRNCIRSSITTAGILIENNSSINILFLSSILYLIISLN